jgi:hypothetical protein
MQQFSWQNIKCDVCGAQPERFAQDLREVPSEGIIRQKVALQNWRAGCAQHPVRSRTFYLDGSITFAYRAKGSNEEKARR